MVGLERTVKIAVTGRVVLSDVDGPFQRSVVHFAGCSIGCPGCFNPHTHASHGDGVRRVSPRDLAIEILEVSRHVTISGGEPTDQDDGLWRLLIELQLLGAESIVLFTGRVIQWLSANRGSWPTIMEEGLVDVVIDGPFMETKVETGELVRGSSNQSIHLVTDKFSMSDFESRGIQVSLDSSGATITGFPDQELIDAIALMA